MYETFFLVFPGNKSNVRLIKIKLMICSRRNDILNIKQIYLPILISFYLNNLTFRQSFIEVHKVAFDIHTGNQMQS